MTLSCELFRPIVSHHLYPENAFRVVIKYANIHQFGDTFYQFVFFSLVCLVPIGRAQFSFLSSSPSSIWLGFLLSSFVIKIADMKNEMISSHSPQRIELVQTLFFCAWIGVFVSVMSANNAITRCCFCVSLRFKSNYKHNSNAHHTSKPYGQKQNSHNQREKNIQFGVKKMKKE